MSSPTTSTVIGRPSKGSAMRSAEKLAGDVAPDADGLDGDGRGRMDRERRIALVFQIVDARPKLTQSLDQIADGPLVHARHPAQAVFPVHQGEHGGERPEGRTRIA